MLCNEVRTSCSETKKRKVDTLEFKAKVGLEALRGAKTINEIGEEYGVYLCITAQSVPQPPLSREPDHENALYREARDGAPPKGV